MEPSRLGDEMLHDARRRVLALLVRDPLFWVLLVVVALAAVRWLNGGVGAAYDAEKGVWFLRGPAFSWFPGSASNAGGQEFAVAVALLVVVMGCRIALGKSARHAFFVLISTFTGVFGLVLAYMHYDGLAVARSLSVFELCLPMHLGMVFGLGLLTTTVAMVSAFELVWRKAHLLLLAGLVGNAAGLLVFAPVWTTAAFLAACVVLFVFAFVYAKLTMGGNAEFKYLVGFGLGLVLAGVVAVGVVSEKPLLEKVESVQEGRFFSAEYLSARDTLSGVSQRVWKTHPWIGTGIGASAQGIRFAATEEDWRSMPPDQAYALNGYWQILVERGIVGAVFAICPLSLLLFSYFRRLVVGVRCRIPPPAAWEGLVALVPVFVLAAADCSILYPGVSVLIAAILAISANSFPKEKVHG